MMGGYYGFGMGAMWFGWFFVFAMGLALVILLVLRETRESSKDDHSAAPSDQKRPIGRAQGILDERYAKGEIDSNEYRERSRHLNSDS